jgi:AraC family transcriptional activator of pobA
MAKATMTSMRGSILFTAPNQVVGGTDNYAGNEGYSLIIHPDFLQGSPGPED